MEYSKLSFIRIPGQDSGSKRRAATVSNIASVVRLHGRARAAVAEIFKVPTVPDLELTVTLQDCRSIEVSADRWIEW